MRASKKKRLVVILSIIGTLLVTYFAAYFLCVSIEFGEGKESTLHLAYARYQPAPFSDGFAQWMFEPARLIDATYLRPRLWRDWQDSQIRRGLTPIKPARSMGRTNKVESGVS